jgi:hypothetical protein
MMAYQSKLSVLAALICIAWTGMKVHGEMIRPYSYIYGSNDVAPSVPIPWAQRGNVGIFSDGAAAQNVTFSHLVLTSPMFTAGNGDNPLIFHNEKLITEFFVSDPVTNAEGVVFFPAMINGTLDPVSFKSNLTLSFLGPKTQSFVLDGNRYTVTIGTYHPFTWKSFGGGPGAGEFDASIDAQVDVSPGAGTPEPSCLVLAGMGLVTVAGAAWRKRRAGSGSRFLVSSPAVY